MVDINTETEFVLTWAPADGSLADMKKRFRVSSSGPQIRKKDDGTTVTETGADRQAGAELIIPKPPETPPFANAVWKPADVNAGESLAAFVHRVQTGGQYWTGRVYHGESKDTLSYIWFDWRNATNRARILLDLDEDARKKLDADPGTAIFKDADTVAVPLAPAVTFEANVAPGAVGGNASKSVIDVSESELTKLQDALTKIERTLDQIASVRKSSLELQKRCDQWLEQLKTIRTDAIFADNLWTAQDPGAGAGHRPEFIAAIDALINKAAPLLLNSPASKLEPSLVEAFQDYVATLCAQMKDTETIRLLAKIIPVQGDLPWTYSHAETKCTIDHVCELAATAAFWIAEGAGRTAALPFIEEAVNAMKAGAPPSENTHNIAAFAVAMVFYPEATTPDSLGRGPMACGGAVTQLYLLLKVHETLAESDSSLAGPAIESVGAAHSKVLERHGFSGFMKDFRKATKDEFKLWGALQNALNAPEKAKEPAKVAALAEAGAVENTGFDERWESIEAAKAKFGAENMGKAYDAYAALSSPREGFTSLFRGVDGPMKGTKVIGVVLLKCSADVLAFTNDKDDPTTTVKAFKGGLDLAKDTLGALKTFKLYTSVEAQEFSLMFGRVSLVVGLIVELIEIYEATQAKDWVGVGAHVLVAGSCVCFLIGGALVIVGAGALVVGVTILVVRGDLFKSDVAIGMGTLLPDDKPAGSFEAWCREALELATEIDAVRTAFKSATFSLQLLGLDVAGRQQRGH